MILSAFISDEFGFIVKITEPQLLEVNKSRKGGKYINEDEATHLNAVSDKKSLNKSPFVRYLAYGSSKDGCWIYRHMILQIEDCIDCLRIIYPQYNYEFEIDHPPGHNTERINGFSANAMNLGWGLGGR